MDKIALAKFIKIATSANRKMNSLKTQIVVATFMLRFYTPDMRKTAEVKKEAIWQKRYSF